MPLARSAGPTEQASIWRGPGRCAVSGSSIHYCFGLQMLTHQWRGGSYWDVRHRAPFRCRCTKSPVCNIPSQRNGTIVHSMLPCLEEGARARRAKVAPPAALPRPDFPAKPVLRPRAPSPPVDHRPCRGVGWRLGGAAGGASSCCVCRCFRLLCCLCFVCVRSLVRGRACVLVWIVARLFVGSLSAGVVPLYYL